MQAISPLFSFIALLFLFASGGQAVDETVADYCFVGRDSSHVAAIVAPTMRLAYIPLVHLGLDITIPSLASRPHLLPDSVLLPDLKRMWCTDHFVWVETDEESQQLVVDIEDGNSRLVPLNRSRITVGAELAVSARALRGTNTILTTSLVTSRRAFNIDTYTGAPSMTTTTAPVGSYTHLAGRNDTAIIFNTAVWTMHLLREQPDNQWLSVANIAQDRKFGACFLTLQQTLFCMLNDAGTGFARQFLLVPPFDTGFAVTTYDHSLPVGETFVGECRASQHYFLCLTSTGNLLQWLAGDATPTTMTPYIFDMTFQVAPDDSAIVFQSTTSHAMQPPTITQWGVTEPADLVAWPPGRFNASAFAFPDWPVTENPPFYPVLPSLQDPERALFFLDAAMASQSTHSFTFHLVDILSVAGGDGFVFSCTSSLNDPTVRVRHCPTLNATTLPSGHYQGWVSLSSESQLFWERSGLFYITIDHEDLPPLQLGLGMTNNEPNLVNVTTVSAGNCTVYLGNSFMSIHGPDINSATGNHTQIMNVWSTARFWPVLLDPQDGTLVVHNGSHLLLWRFLNLAQCDQLVSFEPQTLWVPEVVRTHLAPVRIPTPMYSTSTTFLLALEDSGNFNTTVYTTFSHNTTHLFRHPVPACTIPEIPLASAPAAEGSTTSKLALAFPTSTQGNDVEIRAYAIDTTSVTGIVTCTDTKEAALLTGEDTPVSGLAWFPQPHEQLLVLSPAHVRSLLFTPEDGAVWAVTTSHVNCNTALFERDFLYVRCASPTLTDARFELYMFLVSSLVGRVNVNDTEPRVGFSNTMWTVDGPSRMSARTNYLDYGNHWFSLPTTSSISVAGVQPYDVFVNSALAFIFTAAPVPSAKGYPRIWIAGMESEAFQVALGGITTGGIVTVFPPRLGVYNASNVTIMIEWRDTTMAPATLLSIPSVTLVTQCAVELDANKSCTVCAPGFVEETPGTCATCQAGFFGSACELTALECRVSRCQSFGTCTGRTSGCECQGGRYGPICAQTTISCASGRCGNRGVCTGVLEGCTCTDVPGVGNFTNFDGRSPSHCTSCQNHFSLPDCQSCSFLYYGQSCDLSASVCSQYRCNGHGNCAGRTTGCTCLGGYEGPDCYRCSGHGECAESGSDRSVVVWIILGSGLGLMFVVAATMVGLHLAGKLPHQMDDNLMKAWHNAGSAWHQVGHAVAHPQQTWREGRRRRKKKNKE